MTPPKFLICPDKERNQLYILHTEEPVCLIYIKQETPVRFILQELYSDLSDEEISKLDKMEFVNEAKVFFTKHIER